MMHAVAIETAPRCKICQSDHRPEIDEMLALRSQRTKGPDGTALWPLERVVAQIREWGMDASDKSLKDHFKNHVEMVTSEELAAREQSVAALFDRVLGPGWQGRIITPDESVELVRTLSVHELHRKALEGKAIGLTADHLLKSVAESTKRKNDERVGGLLNTLVGALTERQQRQLPAGEEPEIIDAEVVDES